jgi:hypothetical protein
MPMHMRGARRVGPPTSHAWCKAAGDTARGSMGRLARVLFYHPTAPLSLLANSFSRSQMHEYIKKRKQGDINLYPHKHQLGYR